jgi:tetratricopeptide (TPR) repeat protein
MRLRRRMQCTCRHSRVLFGILTVSLLLLPGLVNAQPASVPTDSLYARADRAADAGSTDAAIQLYSRILARDSTATEALHKRADLYAEQEQYAETAKDLKRLQNLYSTPSDDLLGHRGWYLILAGEVREAREPTRQAMEQNPHYAGWPLNMGHTYALRDQPETAKFYYRKTLRRLNSEEEYQKYLADFNRFAEKERSREDILAMKDWFQVTYLSEGAGGGPGPLALLGTWITIIVGLVSLFQKGEEAMTEKSQRVVRNWLLRDNLAEGGANWADSFKSLFDAVFTDNHLSWTCFSRSVIASATIITAVILGMIGSGYTSSYKVAMLGKSTSVYLGVASAIGFLVLFNAVLDYVSLYQTRWVIGWMADTGKTANHLGLLALDLVLTLGIFAFSVGATQVSAIALQGDLHASFWSALFYEMPLVMYYWIVNGDPLPRASLISTFFTSIWIWLYAIAGLTLQGSTSLLGGVEWMRDLFDVENRPVQALGLMLAILTTSGFLLTIPFVIY